MCSQFRTQVFLRVAAALLLAGSAVPAEPAERPLASRPDPRFAISKPTTFLTGPLRADGYVDYLTALNDRAARGVTISNNSAVLLRQALGVKRFGPVISDRYFELLGVAPPDITHPFVMIGDAANNRLIDEFYQREPTMRSRPLPRREMPALASWIDANAAPLELVVRASQRPNYYEPLVSCESPPLLCRAARTSYEDLRQAAAALHRRAMMRLSDGDVEKAFQDLIACHALGRLWSHAPRLTEAFQAIDVGNEAATGVIALANRGHFSRESVRRYQEVLNSLPPMVPLADTLGFGERCVYLDIICESERAGPGALRQPFVREESKEAYKRVLALVGDPSVDWNEALKDFNCWYDRLVSASRQPTRAERLAADAALGNPFKLPAPQAEENAEHVGGGRSTATRGVVIGRDLGRALVAFELFTARGLFDIQDASTTRMRLMHIVVALAAYRIDHGTYPNNLDSLVPRYLTTVPMDPFSDSQFSYQRNGKGYRLSSVGPNGHGRWPDGGVCSEL